MKLRASRFTAENRDIGCVYVGRSDEVITARIFETFLPSDKIFIPRDFFIFTLSLSLSRARAIKLIFEFKLYAAADCFQFFFLVFCTERFTKTT